MASEEEETTTEEEVVEEEAAPEAGEDDAADGTPGAVTEDTPKTSAKAAAAEFKTPIPVGYWATLADTDAVEEQGGEPGALVRIVESPSHQEAGGADKISPRDHYVQDDDAQLVVMVRGSNSALLYVTADDLENISSDRVDLLPVG